MQIELVGCTCAGKTTLARKMVETGKVQHVDIQLSDDFILGRMRLNWVKSEFVRRRLIESWAFLVCLMFISKYKKLYTLILHICIDAPGSLLYRAKLARVALKKIGIYEIIRNRSSNQQMILVDNEGLLQAIHTLYVHTDGPLYTSNLAKFFELTPLPDVICYLRLPKQALIERTLKRGHNRIPEVSEVEEVVNFISQAVYIFEEMQNCPRFSDRLIVIDCDGKKILDGEHLTDRKVVDAGRVIVAALDKMPTN